MSGSDKKSSQKKIAVILLSGGLDSATTLAIARENHYQCYALTVDYGQRHHIEIEKAKQVAQAFGVKEHKIMNVDISQFGGSALTGAMEMPESNLDRKANDIPSTYVPARNTIFLSLALAWAEVLTAEAVFIGANAVDYSGYPDCRPEYLQAYEQLARLATKAGVSSQWSLKIEAPLLHLTKAEIIKLGRSLGVDYNLTNSCYNPDDQGNPCGQCESCLIRAKGFSDADKQDQAGGSVSG